MATQLSKQITREVKIGDINYLFSLSPDPEPCLLFREKGKRKPSETALPLKDFLPDGDGEEAPKISKKPPSSNKHDYISYDEAISKIGPMLHDEAKKLKALIDDIYEVNLLASDLSDEELLSRGITLPD
tara:strand:+ start:2054 stop:2440 length:387 start_codon:yes stop_codon:yes gene_type:complete